MDRSQELELIQQLGALITHETIKRDLNAITHKLRYPMVDILDKVPGEGMSGKARALKVSRQTLYVWMDEKARPNEAQAKLITNLTGIPAAHILANGYKEETDDTARKRPKTRRKLAKDSQGVPARPTGTRAKRRRVGTKQSLGGSPRKVRRRTRLRHSEPVRGRAGA
jgi:hypothetical protein